LFQEREIVSASPENAGSDLLADTRVECIRPAGAEGSSAPALYRLELSGDWNAAYFPFGGAVSAIALRAMEAELGRPEHVPRTLHTLFCDPVREGAIEIEVETLRAGRGMSQLRATLRNEGSQGPGHTTMAVFGGSREGFTFTDDVMPEIPGPLECPLPEAPPPDHPFKRATFFDNFEMRNGNIHYSWDDDWEGGNADASRWFRFLHTPRREDGTIDPAAFVTIGDTMPPSLSMWVGPRARPFFAPSCDLSIHFLQDTDDEWLLVHSRTLQAGDGYATATANIWDRQQRLVARAHQVMYLRLDL